MYPCVYLRATCYVPRTADGYIFAKRRCDAVVVCASIAIDLLFLPYSRFLAIIALSLSLSPDIGVQRSSAPYIDARDVERRNIVKQFCRLCMYRQFYVVLRVYRTRISMYYAREIQPEIILQERCFCMHRCVMREFDVGILINWTNNSCCCTTAAYTRPVVCSFVATRICIHFLYTNDFLINRAYRVELHNPAIFSTLLYNLMQCQQRSCV